MQNASAERGEDAVVLTNFGDGAISQYDEDGNFLGIYLGLIADPNPVDNIRSMVVMSKRSVLYSTLIVSPSGPSRICHSMS